MHHHLHDRLRIGRIKVIMAIEEDVRMCTRHATSAFIHFDLRSFTCPKRAADFLADVLTPETLSNHGIRTRYFLLHLKVRTNTNEPGI